VNSPRHLDARALALSQHQTSTHKVTRCAHTQDVGVAAHDITDLDRLQNEMCDGGGDDTAVRKARRADRTGRIHLRHDQPPNIARGVGVGA